MRLTKHSIEQTANDSGLVFELSDEYPGHPYVIFYNSNSGAKEIHCRNLKECLKAIQELAERKNTQEGTQ